MNERNRNAATSFVLLGALTFVGCHKSERITVAEPPTPRIEGERIIFPPNAPQLSSLAIQPTAPRTLAISHLTGRLYWNDDATVRVFSPVMGQVQTVLADVGKAVGEGAPLANIDSPDFAQARADARSADANLMAAVKAFARTRDLAEHGAASQKDLEAADAAERAARAERDRAISRLQLYHGSEDSADYVLRAPLPGTVVERNINPGQEVRSDQMLANAGNLSAPLFVITDPTRLWLQLDASDTDLALLHVGQRLQVHTRAFPEKVFNGEVENIGLTLDPQSRTVKVRGVVDNSEQLLKAEMYVFVDVVLNDKNAVDARVDVPAKAVFMVDDKYYVFVQLAAGEFERRQVAVESEKDNRIPVINGLSAGENVVSEGALLLESVLIPN